jgi:hypothetical protein
LSGGDHYHDHHERQMKRLAAMTRVLLVDDDVE